MRDPEDGLFHDLSPMQRAELSRLRDAVGVRERALQMEVEGRLLLHEWLADAHEAMRAAGLPVNYDGPPFAHYSVTEANAHQKVEEEVAKVLARAALQVGGAVPKPRNLVETTLMGEAVKTYRPAGEDFEYEKCPVCEGRIVEYRAEPHYRSADGRQIVVRSSRWEVCENGHVVNERVVHKDSVPPPGERLGWHPYEQEDARV